VGGLAEGSADGILTFKNMVFLGLRFLLIYGTSLKIGVIFSISLSILISETVFLSIIGGIIMLVMDY
jgi:hypothetical protein